MLSFLRDRCSTDNTLEAQIPELGCLLYTQVSPAQNTCRLASFDAPKPVFCAALCQPSKSAPTSPGSRSYARARETSQRGHSPGSRRWGPESQGPGRDGYVINATGVRYKIKLNIFEREKLADTHIKFPISCAGGLASVESIKNDLGRMVFGGRWRFQSSRKKLKLILIC